MPPKQKKHANKKRAPAAKVGPDNSKRAKEKSDTSDVLQAWRRDSCGSCGLDTGRYPWFKTQQTMMDEKGKPWFADKTGKQWPVLTEFKYNKEDCPRCTRDAAIQKYRDDINRRAQESLRISQEQMAKIRIEELADPPKPDLPEKLDDLPDDKFVEAMNQREAYEREKKKRESTKQQFEMVKKLTWDKEKGSFVVEDSAEPAPISFEIVHPSTKPDLHIDVPPPSPAHEAVEPSVPRHSDKAKDDYVLLKPEDMRQ